MNTSSVSPLLAPPQLRPACFEDYPRIKELEDAHLAGSLPAEEWPRLWLDNPLWPRLGSRWPIGWVLEDSAGRVVGSLVSIPSLYRFRGRELLCANGRGWVVSPEYRSFAPWLMEEYVNQPGVDLFINTTVNPRAAVVFSTLSDRIPLGDWQTIAYWVTGYRGFARKALEKLGVPLPGILAFPAAAALRLKDALFRKALPPAPTGIEISTLDDFDSRFDLFWEELIRQNPEKLLAARDRRALGWHFAIPKRRGRLWIFTAVRNGLLRAYAVLNRQDWREGVRRMRLIDYQTVAPDADLLPGLLQTVLRRCAAENFYVLEHLGCGLPKMRRFDDFAPYRRQLPNWPFYYHAADAELDADLRRPELWDPSTFDGDSSFA